MFHIVTLEMKEKSVLELLDKDRSDNLEVKSDKIARSVRLLLQVARGV